MDGRTDNMCENNDHYWPRFWSAEWIHFNEIAEKGNNDFVFCIALTSMYLIIDPLKYGRAEV